MRADTFAKRAKAAVRDIPFRQALASATVRFDSGRVAKMGELPDPKGLRDRGRAIRLSILENLDQHLSDMADAVEQAGGHVHWALDGDEACQIVARIAREHDVELAVKSKSMTSEEIELNPALEAEGITVVETDLGEWIVQLAGERPSPHHRAGGPQDHPGRDRAVRESQPARRTCRRRFRR